MNVIHSKVTMQENLVSFRGSQSSSHSPATNYNVFSSYHSFRPSPNRYYTLAVQSETECGRRSQKNVIEHSCTTTAQGDAIFPNVRRDLKVSFIDSIQYLESESSPLMKVYWHCLPVVLTYFVSIISNKNFAFRKLLKS